MFENLFPFSDSRNPRTYVGTFFWIKKFHGGIIRVEYNHGLFITLYSESSVQFGFSFRFFLVALVLLIFVWSLEFNTHEINSLNRTWRTDIGEPVIHKTQ